jgi:predicted lactoylglutathione lyase
MAKQIYINLPVANVLEATAFYEALGFKKNLMFSDEKASSMMWSDDIIVMLLSRDFYKTFIGDKDVADAQKTSEVALCLTFDSKEEVQKFANTAKTNGGSFYQVENGLPPDMMFGYEVVDLDGHLWEPMWMNPDFNPQEQK